MAKIIVSSSFTRAKFTSATLFLYSCYEANVRTCTCLLASGVGGVGDPCDACAQDASSL